MSSSARKKVFVGLSGGVDSSVSAALLNKAGYDVTGVFIKVWSFDFAEDKQPLFTECSTKDDRLDAMRVCAKLNIPFKELNLEKEYKREVVDYMIQEYKSGKTPNPDVMCNRFIKFGAFYGWAQKNGADFIATGHYAQIRIVKDKGLGIKDFGLFAGSDPQKDQSYFLWQIRTEQLPHILFPIGDLQKPEVRRLARTFGLVTADKKDSQGLCFVGKVDMKEFLGHFIKARKGAVLDESGRVIGEHDGAFLFTLGERHGFRISDVTKATKSQYVVAKNVSQNTLTVSEKLPSGELSRTVREVGVKDCNWIGKSPTASGTTYQARCRYRQPLQKCAVLKDQMKEGADIHIRFDTPQSSITIGQSLVLYDGKVCLGGGIIKDTR